VSASSGLRSQRWLAGDDEVALASRVALASAGVPAAAERPGGAGGSARPVIGIANSASQLNPCNLPLRPLAAAVADGVRAAGGAPAEFPVISLGEDLMKPSAMLYRNLLAIEIEEMVRANPIDGLVLLANCDKSVPGALMGAISANVPTVLVTGGARPRAMFRGRAIGSGTDLWRMWDERRAGRLDDAAWHDLETALGRGCGACNTMGTASTMAVLCEVLGFMVPGSAAIPAGDPRSAAAARRAGELAVAAVLGGDIPRPQDIVTPAALANAVRVLHAIGGSTNAVIHLAAILAQWGGPLAGAPSDQIIPAGQADYKQYSIYPNTPNLAMARKLMTASGVKTPVTLVLRTQNDTPGFINMAEVIQANLKPIGINVKIVGTPNSVNSAIITNYKSKTAMGIEPWSLDFPDGEAIVNTGLDPTQPDNPANMARFGDAAFDQPFSAAAAALGAARVKDYETLDEQLMAQQAPYAPLFNPKWYDFVSTRVGGYVYSEAMDAINYNTLFIK
jgi:hypothetical protein